MDKENKWNFDEYGYVSNDSLFFHISHIKVLEKSGLTDINIFWGEKIGNFNFISTEERDRIYDWLKNMKLESARISREEAKKYEERAQTQVALQGVQANLASQLVRSHIK